MLNWVKANWNQLSKRIRAVGLRVRKQNIEVLVQIWRDKYPPEDTKEHTFLEKVLISPPLIGRALSLSNLVAFFRPGGQPAYLFIDLYLLVWVFGLIILLLFWSSIGILSMLIAAYRILDIITYQLCIILIDSQRPKWRLASLRRSFLFSMLNLTEIVMAFAVIYLTVGNIVENKPGGASIQSPLSALYYSSVTMATLGYGEFVPKDDLSRGIVIAQIFTEILFFFAVLPAFVSNMIMQLGGKEWKIPSKRE